MKLGSKGRPRYPYSSLQPSPTSSDNFDMALEIRNGITGKVCSRCRTWKALHEYPTDRTHGPTQGGRHCRCRACHRDVSAEKRKAAREGKDAAGLPESRD